MQNNEPLKREHINCNDTALQTQVLSRHAIMPQLLNSMVRSFFSTGIVPVPKVIPGADLDALIGDNDCNNVRIKILAEETSQSSNDDIDLTIEMIPETFEVNYSIVLFRAVLAVHRPDEIHFFKAKKQDGGGEWKYDVVFKAVKAGSPVYYGDLSDLIP